MNGTKDVPADRELADRVARRHLRFGWWSLAGFLSLGIVLEVMHGLKITWYLDDRNEIRRLMGTLAHAHGTLLALVHVVFGLTVLALPPGGSRWRGVASGCLMAGSLMLPGGFLLGGLVIYDGDPGLGVFLVPPGAALALVGVLMVALSLGEVRDRADTGSGAAGPAKRGARRRR